MSSRRTAYYHSHCQATFPGPTVLAVMTIWSLALASHNTEHGRTDRSCQWPLHNHWHGLPHFQSSFWVMFNLCFQLFDSWNLETHERALHFEEQVCNELPSRVGYNNKPEVASGWTSSWFGGEERKRRGLVHATLCDGPQKQVCIMMCACH